ncbi:MAG TPA: SseB family protein [Micromonosporaceae bacterium]|nr:SseB family protein [Micromonosporaceae bacterium]
MNDWGPATEAEAAMREALLANDQEEYFSILAQLDLLLPVAGGALGGPSDIGWGTWTADGRTHVLAFTSPRALEECLAGNAGPYRRLSFDELAATWPNIEWWLAVNPGLPIEAYLPAWFVNQINRGDVRLPGRTLGARARMEHARRLRGRPAPPHRPGPPPAGRDGLRPSPLLDQPVGRDSGLRAGTGSDAPHSTRTDAVDRGAVPDAAAAARGALPDVARPVEGRPVSGTPGSGSVRGGRDPRGGEPAALPPALTPPIRAEIPSGPGPDARGGGSRPAYDPTSRQASQPVAPPPGPLTPPLGPPRPTPRPSTAAPASSAAPARNAVPPPAVPPPAVPPPAAPRPAVPPSSNPPQVEAPHRNPVAADNRPGASSGPGTDPEETRVGLGQLLAESLGLPEWQRSPSSFDRTQRIPSESGSDPREQVTGERSAQGGPGGGGEVDRQGRAAHPPPLSQAPDPDRTVQVRITDPSALPDLADQRPAESLLARWRRRLASDEDLTSVIPVEAVGVPRVDKSREPETDELTLDVGPVAAAGRADLITTEELPRPVVAVEAVVSLERTERPASAERPAPHGSAGRDGRAEPDGFAEPDGTARPQPEPGSPVAAAESASVVQPTVPVTDDGPAEPVVSADPVTAAVPVDRIAPAAPAAPETADGRADAVPADAAPAADGPSDGPSDGPVDAAPAADGPADGPVDATAVDAAPATGSPAPAEQDRLSNPESEHRPEPAPSPPGDVPDATGFQPANAVEEDLLAAATSGNGDGFLATLLLAKVLVPGWAGGDEPVAPAELPRATIGGTPHLLAFTSTERMSERFGADAPVAGWMKFARLIAAWPAGDLSCAINPDTPVGVTIPGVEVLALANWAGQLGLGGGPDPEPEPTPTRTPKRVRDTRPASAPLLMQKTISAEQVSFYLDRSYDRVSGFVHRANEVAHLRTPEDFYQALGLHYTGSAFKPDAAEVYLLRWTAARVNLYRIPYGGQHETAMRAMEGWVIERAPFRGNGFAPSETGDVIAEFKVDSARLPHGTQLWRVDRDGDEQLVAVLDADWPRWQRVEPS